MQSKDPDLNITFDQEENKTLGVHSVVKNSKAETPVLDQNVFYNEGKQSDPVSLEGEENQRDTFHHQKQSSPTFKKVSIDLNSQKVLKNCLTDSSGMLRPQKSNNFKECQTKSIVVHVKNKKTNQHITEF